MATLDTSRKRKLNSSRSAKGKQPPFKRFRSDTYNSDSDGEDDGVTARDAPRPDLKSEMTVTTTTISPQSIIKAKKAQVGPTTSTKEKIPRDNKPKKDESDSGDETVSEETDEVDIDVTVESEASDSDSDTSSTSHTGSASARAKTKRRDPAAFATSISAILGSSLSRNKRADPVLSRSKFATEISKALSESKLEEKAKKQLVNERRLAKEKGRVKDVLIGDRKAVIDDDFTQSGQVSSISAAEILATEKRLRKVAQRGVIHLFNAVRAAQVRGEEESRKTKAENVVGISNREARVKEMSRNAFLDLVGAGGEKR